MANCLKAWRKVRGLTQEALGAKVGTDKTVISKLERNERKLTRGWLEKLGPALNAEPGDILKSPESVLDQEPHMWNTADLPPIGGTPPGIVGISEWDVRSSAGPGAENRDEKTEINIHYFSEMTVRHELNAQPENCHVIRVEGDSMEPTLRTGDRVMIDVSKTLPTPPGLFVLHDGLGLVVKRLEHLHGSDPATVRIISDNKRHEPYERTLDEAHIIGRVIWSARKL